MPQINPVILLSCLRQLNNKLYNIYVDCTNVQISDALLEQINYIDYLISQIEPLI